MQVQVLFVFFFLLHYYSYFFSLQKKYHAVCQSISPTQLLWCVHVCKQMQSVSLSSTSVSLLFSPCCLTGFTTPFFVCWQRSTATSTFFVIYFAFIVFISDLDCSNTSLTAKLTFWKTEMQSTMFHFNQFKPNAHNSISIVGYINTISP